MRFMVMTLRGDKYPIQLIAYTLVILMAVFGMNVWLTRRSHRSLIPIFVIMYGVIKLF
jgi:hypothetical protein